MKSISDSGLITRYITIAWIFKNYIKLPSFNIRKTKFKVGVFFFYKYFKGTKIMRYLLLLKGRCKAKTVQIISCPAAANC